MPTTAFEHRPAGGERHGRTALHRRLPAVGVAPPLVAGGADPATGGSTQLSVEVSLNGQQFTGDGAEFVYFGRPRIASLSPACGSPGRLRWRL